MAKPKEVRSYSDEATEQTVATTEITPAEEDLSLAELVAGLSSDFSTLVRKEIDLARAETMQTINTGLRSIVTMMIGGLVAYAGLIILLGGIAIWVGQALDNPWIGGVAVGAIVVVLGIILLVSGRAAFSNLSVTPERTVQTLQEDAQWAKEKVDESA